MNTEITEHNVAGGSIFYNANSHRSRAIRTLCDQLFARRGFQWVPLQTPGLGARLGMPGAVPPDEMKVQLATGPVLGGLDAWLVLLRSVWWLQPIGMLLSLPGFHSLGQAGYRWMAGRRRGGSGKRKVPRRAGSRRRTIPFLDLP